MSGSPFLFFIAVIYMSENQIGFIYVTSYRGDADEYQAASDTKCKGELAKL